MRRERAIEIETGSDNVYADLGYENAAEMQRKSRPAAVNRPGFSGGRFT